MNNYKITYSNELYHHGIKGQRWGVRRFQNEDGSLTVAGEKRYAIDSARQEYKSAKALRKDAAKNMSSASILNRKGGLDSQKAYRKAELREIDAKAKLKAAKAHNSEKAEFKAYRKAMQKTGVRASYYDEASGGRSTDLYNHISTKKGKAYADAVERSVRNRAIAQLSAGVIALGASYAAEMYLLNKR